MRFKITNRRTVLKAGVAGLAMPLIVRGGLVRAQEASEPVSGGDLVF